MCNNLYEENINNVNVFNNDYSKEEIYKIMDSLEIPISIVITDAQARIIFMNSNYAEFLNVNPLDVMGHSIDEVVPNSRVSVVLSTGKPEISQVHTYNNGVKSIVHRIPFFNREGKVEGCFGLVLFKSMNELKELAEINHVLNSKLNAYQNEIKSVFKAKYTFEDIIGKSTYLQQRKLLARRFAASDTNILITGETGTGKEVWAHAIHNASSRKEHPFVTVNCGAIPENLFESELFGYEEGAFTGAKKGGKLGKFQLANGGTLFLDEIGDMPLSMQVKILRALQEKEVEKVGGSQTEKIDIRIIAATNRNILERVHENKFREDLYYRLYILSINLPPLREQREDIELLVKHFITKHCNNNGVIMTIDSNALEMLQHYSWPGNIRELSTVIERLSISTDCKTIDASDLPEAILLESDLKHIHVKDKLDRILAKVEKEYIIRTLKICKNSKSESARYLGIARSRLYRKLEEYNIGNHNV